MRQYVDMVPATREDIDANGNIIPDVDNWFVKVARWDRIMNEVIVPYIIQQCRNEWDVTSLYKNDHLNMVYVWPWTQYLDNDWEWKDTKWVNTSIFKDKPQRVDSQLKNRYGNGWTLLLLLDGDWKEILRYDVLK